MMSTFPLADVVMLGTFAMWNLGTLQARALPLASELQKLGVRPAIVTTPWDEPSEAGAIDMIDSVPVINTSSISLRVPVRAVRQQIAWTQRLSPQVVHVFKPKGFGGIAGRALGSAVPLIVDSDDWEGDGGWNQAASYSPLQQRVFQYQEIDLLRRAARVTAASTLLAERARRLRCIADDGSVHQIENGLTDARATQLAAGRTMPPSGIHPPVILLYSRFAEFEVGWLAAFLSTLDQLADRPLTVRVIGDIGSQADPGSELGQLIMELMGYVASERLPSLLGSSTLAVYPYRDSLITRSKQSVKLLEQMAAGCPIIASDIGDIARTLGTAGVTISDASPAAFAREAVKLIEQPHSLDQMSALSQSRLRARFGFDVLARRLLDVYRSAGLR